ncbi:MAG: putative glycoside hydrolase [bacterium]|nr:putative glycoside hydrolase [bacterium]
MKIFILLLFLFIASGAFFLFLKTDTNKTGLVLEQEIASTSQPTFKAPEIIKAVYFTTGSARSKSSINYLLDLASTTEINSVVIDIKDFSGNIKVASKGDLIEKLHQNGIYVIARMEVFQDPVFANARPDLAIHSQSATSTLWLDNYGLAWIDPAAKEYWDYILNIAKSAVAQDFDEINFDYIRFPSDGNLQDMVFPVWQEKASRSSVLRDFYRYLREGLAGTKISIDLFGLSTVNFDDLGVGQIIEDAFDNFDFVSPMVYPSHYSSGFQGYDDPNQYPYEVIKYSMEGALGRLSAFKKTKETNVKLRPWLQHFNLHGVEYDAEKIKLEIQAVKDALGSEFSGFMLWSPTNIYIKEALIP